MVSVIISNKQLQTVPTAIEKNQPLAVGKGDLIKIVGKQHFKIARKGSNLLLKNADGEEFLLQGFYAQYESGDFQLLVWDDETDLQLKVSSLDDQNDQVAAGMFMTHLSGQPMGLQAAQLLHHPQISAVPQFVSGSRIY